MFGKYEGRERDLINRYLDYPSYDYVKDFENAFSLKLKGKYAIAVNSGTSALHAALVACNVSGFDVLMPALCPAMVAFAIIHAGGNPVFCDVDPVSHLLSADSVRERITEKTRAILGVSLHGLPMAWEVFKPIAASHGAYLIGDCAQALGAKGIGKADITCFSFEDKKHITTGSEGGMILTDNPELAMKARKFAGIGYKHMTADAGRTSLAAETYQDPDYERFDTIGLNYRMSRIQAVIGIAQLEQLDHIVARRRAVAQMFAAEVEGTIYPNCSYYTFALTFSINWKEFYNKFKAHGGDGFYAMPQLPYNEPALEAFKADCPIAEDLQKRSMLFKTNYRDLGQAEKQADILRKTLQSL